MKTHKKKFLAVIMSILMIISVAVCSVSTVSAAETTKSSSSSSSESSSDSDADESPDKDDKDENTDDEKNISDYSWSSNTVGNSNLVADEDIIMENGTYQFIAVTTRDDDVFYVIIDKTKTENNVYFLNEVDTADIEKFAQDDSNVSNDTSVEETTVSAGAENSEATSEKKTNSGDSQFIIYLVVGVVILGGLGFVFFKLKGKNGKKKSNDTDEYDDDEFDYEDEVNEDNVGEPSEEK